VNIFGHCGLHEQGPGWLLALLGGAVAWFASLRAVAGFLACFKGRVRASKPKGGA
jgi:hypothetical protein